MLKTPLSIVPAFSPSLPLRSARIVFVVGLLACVGCSFSEPVRFELNTEGREPNTIGPAQAEAITETLKRLFGTPDEPELPEGVTLDLDLLRSAAGPIRSDAQGKQFGLYRQHCVMCHGISGSGAGPSAALLTPYPRDFRSGVFKFTSTAGGAKPVASDLERTLLLGVPGTAMPSFAMLDDKDIDALVEYVKYLSIRGEVEQYLLQLVVDEDEYLPLSMRDVREEGVQPIAELWQSADATVVVPPPEPATDTLDLLAASIARGRELYADKDAQCVKCHGPSGQGDGEEDELYDDWNEPKKGVSSEQMRELAAKFSLPIQQLRPRDFREGTFHGGARPEDIYWRIHVGIKGTPMPAVGPAPGAEGVFTPEEIWDVVNYIRSLSK